MEIIYERAIILADVEPARVAGSDIGLNNLAAVTSNQPGLTPLLVQGQPLKALNQWYNKRRACLQAKLPAGVSVSRRLDLLTDNRQRQITSYRHVASRRVVDWLVAHRHTGDRHERRLETSGWIGQADQSKLRVYPAGALHRDA